MAMALHSLSPLLIPKKITPLRPYFSPLAVRLRRHQHLAGFPLSELRTFPGRPQLLHGRNVRVLSGDGNEAEEDDFRGDSSLPERFRHLTKEVPEPPVRWPWFVVAGFLLYAWRAVFFELLNWKNAAVALLGFLVNLSKLVLALVLQVVGRPITSLIYCVETAIYTVRAFYSYVIAYAPIPELTWIILITSVVFAIAETTVPDSVNSQSYALTISGLAAYATLSNYVTIFFLWTVLALVYGYSRLVRKQDNVSSALPIAAVHVAVGATWVQLLAIGSYLALAIFHHSKKPQGKEESAVAVTQRKLPLPLLMVALAIGVRLAANWAGYRHLTWMIV